MTTPRVRALTVSTRLLQPFYKLLASYQLTSRAQLETLRALGPDARVPVDTAYALLSTAVELTGDRDLGLKAGRIFDFDDGGPPIYAASSANTLRAAIEVIGRYMALLTDATGYRLSIEGERAVVRLENTVEAPRAAADFQASAVRTHHRRTHPIDLPGLEWSFLHERPASTEEYERTFGETPLHFSAAYLGFSFDARSLDIPLRTADARLHEQVLRQIEAALAEVPPVDTVAGDVRKAIVRDLASARLSVAHVAQELSMSRRTLARRLQTEGTSFSELVDDTRRRMAQHYLADSARSVAQIALVLGFSEVATFYRAFRRWTQMTPIEYRQKLLAAVSGGAPEPGATAAPWTTRRAL
jgi:AraC-like DNA-binding protein